MTTLPKWAVFESSSRTIPGQAEELLVRIWWLLLHYLPLQAESLKGLPNHCCSDQQCYAKTSRTNPASILPFHSGLLESKKQNSNSHDSGFLSNPSGLPFIPSDLLRHWRHSSHFSFSLFHPRSVLAAWSGHMILAFALFDNPFLFCLKTPPWTWYLNLNHLNLSQTLFSVFSDNTFTSELSETRERENCCSQLYLIGQDEIELIWCEIPLEAMMQFLDFFNVI